MYGPPSPPAAITVTNTLATLLGTVKVPELVNICDPIPPVTPAIAAVVCIVESGNVTPEIPIDVDI
jgi:hypothetical protein